MEKPRYSMVKLNLNSIILLISPYRRYKKLNPSMRRVITGQKTQEIDISTPEKPKQEITHTHTHHIYIHTYTTHNTHHIYTHIYHSQYIHIHTYTHQTEYTPHTHTS